MQEVKASKKESEFLVDTVNHCLSDDCKDCTGSYINELLHHRLRCLCQCHGEEPKAPRLVGDTTE